MYTAGCVRASGGAIGGNVARGSPARVLHELIGVERERVTELMSQLQLTAADLEKQREAAAAAGNALRSAAMAEGGDFLAIAEGDEEGGGDEGDGVGMAASVSGGFSGGIGSGNVAKAIKRSVRGEKSCNVLQLILSTVTSGMVLPAIPRAGQCLPLQREARAAHIVGAEELQGPPFLVHLQEEGRLLQLAWG